MTTPGGELAMVLRWFRAAWWFVWLHLRRCWAADLRSLPVSPGEAARLAAFEVRDEVTSQYLVWRRSTLLVAGVITGLSAGGQALAMLEFYLLFPFLWGRLGAAVLIAYHLALFALPAAALLAWLGWARPRRSRQVLLVGWATSVLGPVALFLIPPHWLLSPELLSGPGWGELIGELGQSVGVEVPAAAEGASRRFVCALIDVVGGLFYGLLLLPNVLSLLPGLFRACLRLKLWLPESVLPGWSMVTAAPLYAFGFLLAAVVVNQLFSSWLLTLGAVLFAAAPLVYVAAAPRLLRPTSGATRRHLWWVQVSQLVLTVAALALLGADLSARELTYDGETHRLFGLDPDTSWAQPWDLFQFVVEYAGRALVVTVVVADAVLWMHAVAWASGRAFTRSADAAEYEGRMGRLSALLAGTPGGAVPGP